MLRRYLLLILLFWGVGPSLHAEQISKYDINVTVEQCGELSIVESIYYDFERVQKHGIFRDIPFTIKIDGRIIDLGLYDFSVQMDDSYVQWEQSTINSSNAGEVIRLKIGHPSRYISGKHLYRIYYRVKKGVLPAAQNENNDAIRWNIIGTGWQVPIHNITSTFKLPPSLSQQSVAISTFTGSYGSKDSKATSSWKNAQALEVKVASLRAYEGATVELAYPFGVLDQNGQENIKPTFMDWFFANWHWAALAGFLLYFREMFKRYTGFVDRRSVAVQYEAPKDLSLLQSGLLLDKFADDEDFSAAILELAHLGYITIKQERKNSDPLLIRTEKVAEGLTMDQNYLLNHTLFSSGKSFILKGGSESRAKRLMQNFSHINENLYTWSVSDGYMAENPKRIRKNFLTKSILWLLPVIALVAYSLYIKYGLEVLFVLIFPIVFGAVGITIMVTQSQRREKLFGLFFAGAGMMPLFAIMQDGLSFKSILMGPVGVLIVIVMAMMMVYKKIGKFTQKGAYASTKLLGLKEFISRVKEDEIKRRLDMDPLYLEKILPYAVLFNETEHWLSFYDILDVKNPHWYSGNIHNMGRFLKSVSSAATPPSQSSTGGGGFSGRGGSSGGGGGGGGGGSW